MSVDPAFANVGKQAGLEAWRIEKLQPVRVPADQIGKLYSGDSYIILKTNLDKSGTSWNIHFWLGKETSQDESGIAAYKSVELDESLGGGPVQYRECQGHESELFLSYFKKSGLEYLDGGIASGFKTVKRDEYETRLFQVKGKRTVRVTQVPIKAASLTIDDVYVLDAGLELYVFNGKDANRQEKAKGLEFVRKLNNEGRGSRANITFIDEDPKNAVFWKTLGGFLNVTRVGESDEAHEHAAKKSTTVLHVSDSSNDLQVDDVTPANGVLTKSLLLTDDVFIVDVGEVVYVWVGKGASSSERKNAMTVATKYLQKNARSLQTPITRVVESGEPPVFKALFKAWSPPKLLEFGRQPSTLPTPSQRKLDVNALVSSLQTSEEDIGSDPTQAGNHEVKIWRIENMAKVEIPQSQYGQFYGGDSYIILHTTTPPSGKVTHVIYFWQGRTSSTDEKASSALLASKLDDEMGGSPVQVRVVQGKEPAHFRALFKGKMIIHAGGKASGFANVKDTDSYDTDGVSLFHVKGTKAENTVASQVDELASNLNSGDCFVLVTPQTVFEWQGSGSSAAERTISHSIAEILRGGVRTSDVLTEGNESEEFWGFLGGKAPYSDHKAGFECPHEPRLFQCSNVYGYFHAEEIFNFAQDDLNVDDVFLLDTYTSLYIWIGSGANEAEKRESLKLADDYLAAAQSDGRGDGTPVITVHCNSEPPMFTSNFLAWDKAFFQQNEFIDPYEARLRKLKEEKEKNRPKDAVGTVTSAARAAAAAPPPAPVVRASAGGSFTYEQLLAGVDGIDLTCRESYLSDAEFQKIMGSTKAEFAKLPKWRQQAKKKETNLF